MAIYAEALGAKAAPSFPQRFQKLKADTHRQLVEMIDLTKLGHWKQERLQKEVRRLAERMTVNTSELLNEADRERLRAAYHSGRAPFIEREFAFSRCGAVHADAPAAVRARP